MKGVRLIVLAATVAATFPFLVDPQQAAAQEPGRATISGRVTDTAGNPLEGICVHPHAMTPPPGGGEALHIGETNTNGDYEIDVRAAPYRINFYPCQPTRNYVAQTWNGRATESEGDIFEVAPGEHRSGIDAVLREGARITGRVLSSTGEPVTGICIQAAPPNPEFQTPAQEVRAPGLRDPGQVSPDGSYELVGLPTGTFTIRYFDCIGGRYLNQWYLGKRYSTADHIQVTEGSTTSLEDVRMQRAGMITGTVTGPGGSPVADLCVTVVSLEPGMLIDDFWDMAPGNQYRTAEDGTYRTWGIRPGPYRVMFGCQDGEERWVPQSWSGKFGNRFDPVVVGSGETVTGIDANLRPGARIKGQVTSFAGEVLAGICVTAASTDGDVHDTVTRPDGTYSTPPLPEGQYTVGFAPCAHTASTTPWLPQFFDGKANLQDADRVGVTAGRPRTDVNARMVEGSRPACVVPDLDGRRFAAAKSSIADSHCGIGKVSRKQSSKPEGRVLKQRPEEGSQRPRRSDVRLVLSAGRG